jgi:hypothetical protein
MRVEWEAGRSRPLRKRGPPTLRVGQWEKCRAGAGTYLGWPVGTNVGQGQDPNQEIKVSYRA